ncbi:MAG: hypothetical protein A2X81_18415 [Desulfobacterales bacterium GWB2_56_26]|nr:MAG: hypothetical protein A2X81_18415 [Desulfobacterales bacterium GWB2_56_26]
MTPKTFIPGKDASLEDTIVKATTLLETLNFPTETVSWQNPAPDCWSVHLRAAACPHLYTNGKGTSRLACQASALGEFFERLQTNFFFAEYFLDEREVEQPFFYYPDEKWFPPEGDEAVPIAGPDGTELLDGRLRALYDPDGELRFDHLCDNNTESTRRGICALPFRSLSQGGKPVYFPVSLLNNLYVSNGMAAGNSPTECCAQAIAEIVERYVKNIIISKGVSLPNVPEAVLKKNPRLSGILDTLADHGFIVRVKDGSLGGRFPVICALLADTASGGTYAAFGASCRFETAIERTLTELLQGRNLDSLRHFHPPSHDLSAVADPFNLESHFVDSDGLLAWSMFRDKADFSFSPWEFHGSTEDEFKRLTALIEAEGGSLYRAEYCHCGLYSCRILAPGMSEIYPIDDLIWNNRAAGASLRTELLRLPGMKKPALADFLDRLEVMSYNDHQLVAGCIGILFDESSAWTTLRFGELKAMLHLAMGNREDAAEWCGWCLDYAALPPERLRLYRLLHTLLGFILVGEDLDSFGTGFSLFYRDFEVEEARRIIAGRITFPGLHFGRTWKETSAAHGQLLQIYEQLHEIKARHKRTED